jgi:hypothetical protein
MAHTAGEALMYSQDTSKSSRNDPRPRDESNGVLVVYAASGNKEGVQTLLDNELADAMYQNGLPLLIAAAIGDNFMIQVMLCTGAFRKHTDVMRLAARILTAKRCFSDAQYVSRCADIYDSGCGPSDDNQVV